MNPPTIYNSVDLLQPTDPGIERNRPAGTFSVMSASAGCRFLRGLEGLRQPLDFDHARSEELTGSAQSHRRAGTASRRAASWQPYLLVQVEHGLDAGEIGVASRLARKSLGLSR